MIDELTRVKIDLGPYSTREVWVIPGIWLVGTKANLPVGKRYPAYTPHEGDYMAGDLGTGDIAALRSITVIAPGGEILVHNGMMAEPTTWEGSLRPVCNGVFIKAKTDFEAVIPSILHCMSPPGNGKNFQDKSLRREFIEAGESYTFRSGDIGFGVVYGAEEMRGFEAAPGDVLTVDQDTVLAVVSLKECG